MSDAEDRFAKRVNGHAWRRLKSRLVSGEPVDLPTTKEQMDELERSYHGMHPRGPVKADVDRSEHG